jgi:hypothetical protein
VSRRWSSLGGLVILVVAVISLSIGAVHGERIDNNLTAAHFSTSAQRSTDYFACLTTQARSVIRPQDVVYLPDPSLSSWVTLTKVIGGWAHETLDPHHSTLGLALVHEPSGPTCEGQAVVAARRTADGKVLFSRGRNQ